MPVREDRIDAWLCLGAACTECIFGITGWVLFSVFFASALPARSASLISSGPRFRGTPLPRRCLHGVHRESRTIPDYGYSTLPRRCLHGVHRPKGQWPRTAYPVFASALPARSASSHAMMQNASSPALPRRCLHGVHPRREGTTVYDGIPLPRRCLHGVHPCRVRCLVGSSGLCLGAACTECIVPLVVSIPGTGEPLPRRCLHGVHPAWHCKGGETIALCLGAACTECIVGSTLLIANRFAFASALPARSASIAILIRITKNRTLPRRCLHGVHLQS